jgi:cell division protein ZapA
VITEAKIEFQNYQKLVDRIRKLTKLIEILSKQNNDLKNKLNPINQNPSISSGNDGTQELKTELKRLKKENKLLKEKEYLIKTKIDRLAVKLDKINIWFILLNFISFIFSNAIIKMEKQSTKVNILGSEYALKSDSDPQYIQELAVYVDHKMKKLLNETQVKSQLKIAVLTSVNISDELFRLKKKYDNLIKEIESTSGEITESLDNFLSQYSHILK